MKNSRQQKILEIIEKHDIDTQETLIAKLAEEGYTVTQTTVSRDIREMRLVKDLGPDGKYHYNLPSKHVTPEFDVKLRKIFRSFFDVKYTLKNVSMPDFDYPSAIRK